ncbi:MAG: DUF5996 family protein [Cyclobacteriaceae bacterium]
MNKWKRIKGVDREVLRDTRKTLHQTVQIVSAFPRHLLPHDPTDGTASLEWNPEDKALQSIPVPNSHDLEMRSGLSFKDFLLTIKYADMSCDKFHILGKSVNAGMDWLKRELKKMAFASESLTLDLPYEIESYDNAASLMVNKRACKEYARLYGNTFQALSELVDNFPEAHDIRCWPHHFDLATLIPVGTDDKGEITKSIGVGLSPGDEGVEEPYLYVNVWPDIELEVLQQHVLPAGRWNTEGWSGAVLTYTELLNSSDQADIFTQFIEMAVAALQKEST